MKIVSKILLAAALSMLTFSSANAIKIIGAQITPDLGIGIGKTSISNEFSSNSSSEMTYSGYARVWVGAFNIAVAPQIKADYTKLSDTSFNNKQIGASVGYNLDLVAFSITPYLGANHSSFGGDLGRELESTISFNYGVVAKVMLIPVSVGIHGVYQEPKIKGSSVGISMNSIQLTLGFSI